MEKVIDLQPQSIESAPEGSKEILENAQKKMGFIPNMYKYFANSPALFKAYTEGYNAFRADSGFSPAEQEVVFLTVSVTNKCHYCEAAHGFLAKTSSKVPQEVIEAILSNTPIPDKKLAALSQITKAILAKNGWLDRPDIEAFTSAGYSEKNVFDVIAGVGVKLFSNYMNHITQTPIDPVFQK